MKSVLLKSQGLPGQDGRAESKNASRRRRSIVALTFLVAWLGGGFLLGLLRPPETLSGYKVMMYTVNPSVGRLVKRRMNDRSLEAAVIEVYKRHYSLDECKAWLIDRGDGRAVLLAGVEEDLFADLLCSGLLVALVAVATFVSVRLTRPKGTRKMKVRDSGVQEILVYGMAGGTGSALAYWLWVAGWKGYYVGRNDLFGAWLQGCMIVSILTFVIQCRRRKRSKGKGESHQSPTGIA